MVYKQRESVNNLVYKHRFLVSEDTITEGQIIRSFI